MFWNEQKMKFEELYYLTNNGRLVSSRQLQFCYEIVTGRECSDPHERIIQKFDVKYSGWLYGLIQQGKIVQVFREEDMDVDFCIDHDAKFLAIRIYRETRGSTIMEAKEYVEQKIKEKEGEKSGEN